jgi:hypothetical protein
LTSRNYGAAGKKKTQPAEAGRVSISGRQKPAECTTGCNFSEPPFESSSLGLTGWHPREATFCSFKCLAGAALRYAEVVGFARVGIEPAIFMKVLYRPEHIGVRRQAGVAEVCVSYGDRFDFGRRGNFGCGCH